MATPDSERRIRVWSGLLGLAFFVFLWPGNASIPRPQSEALALLVLMAWWWVSEALPIHWTALAPLAVFPALTIHSGLGANFELVARPYLDPNIFLFLGGMLLGAGLEAHGLHKRIALGIMVRVGTDRLPLGFLLSTAFISLWISNTAAAVMMLPIGLAVLSELERREGRRMAILGQAVMLAIAYGANLGGIGTKIGTAPNVQLTGFVSRRFGTEIGFVDYLAIGLPFVAIFLPVAALALHWLSRGERPTAYSRDVLVAELASMGSMGPGERKAGGFFLLACVLWIAGKPLKDLLGLGIDPDPIVSMGVASMLFATGVLGWRALGNVSWSVLVLLGGSFALAGVVKQSGLADLGAQQLAAAATLPPLVLMMAVTLSTVLLSAFSSNTATTQVMLEVVSSALSRFDARPLAYLAGVSISASCDFMLPAGTPPNAVVFGSGYVRLPVMAGVGALLDLAAALAAALWCHFGVARWL